MNKKMSNLSEKERKELEAYQAKAEEQKRISELEAKQEADNQGRIYKSDKQFIDHDLYKLEVAAMRQDKGLDGVFVGGRQVIPPKPNFVPVEHCHFYHSHDSSGRKQQFSTSTAGHCHEITIVEKNGKLEAICSDSVIRSSNGKTFQMKNKESIHKHDVTYLVSEKIEVRASNKEAKKAGLRA
jgi:hypothetical protein